MRILTIAALALTLLAVPAALSGCKTDQPGVKSTRFTQYTTVTAPPAEVADAAEAVLNELELRNVRKQATGVDAVVTAMTAQGSEVEVSIEREGQTGSNVSVWVGKLGDPALGTDIVSRIKQRIADDR